MQRWKRVLLSVGLLVAILVVFLCFFGMQAFFVLEAHNVAGKLPFVRRTPVTLSDTSVSQESGMNLSYFGYDLRFPGPTSTRGKRKSLAETKPLSFFVQAMLCPYGADSHTSYGAVC